jgi:RHS repeat-associated protein
MTSESSGADFAFGYAGTFWDGAMGMNRMGLRFYDPSLGRFASQDPLGLLPDVNPYRYCGNQPLTYIDPSGGCGRPRPDTRAGRTSCIHRRGAKMESVASLPGIYAAA